MDNEDGIYVVLVNGERHIAERIGDEWYTTGVDYDIWQYRCGGPLTVEPLWRLNIEQEIPMFERVFK